jgi:branched-chain amino acid transport system substrate-binding protein
MRLSRGGLAVCAIVMSGTLAACGAATGEKAASDGGGLCSAGSIKIGAVKALSGGFSFFDKVGDQADQLAVDEVNQQGGIDGCKVEMTTKDMQSNPAVGGQVARELIRDKSQILLVPNDQDLGMPAAQAAQQAGIFSLSPAGASDTFGTAVGQLFANGGTTSAENAYAAVQFAKSKGYDSVYYVTLDAYEYFNLMEKNFRSLSGLHQLGRSVVQSGQTDFSAVVSDIKRSVAGADHPVVYVATQYPDAPTLINQLRKAGVDTPVIGNAAFSSRDLPKALGGNTKDVYYAAGAYFEGDDISADAKDFIAAYEKKFKTFPENLNATESYWTMWALFDAIKAAHSTDGKAIADALFAQRDLQVPLKEIGKWQDGHIVGSTVIIGFTPDGKFEKVATYNAADK